MLEPDCLEQEGHIGKWRRLPSEEDHAGSAIYTSFETTSSGITSSHITSCLGMQWLAD